MADCSNADMKLSDFTDLYFYDSFKTTLNWLQPLAVSLSQSDRTGVCRLFCVVKTFGSRQISNLSFTSFCLLPVILKSQQRIETMMIYTSGSVQGVKISVMELSYLSNMNPVSALPEQTR